jgi:hypothetical protein
LGKIGTVPPHALKAFADKRKAEHGPVDAAAFLKEVYRNYFQKMQQSS